MPGNEERLVEWLQSTARWLDERTAVVVGTGKSAVGHIDSMRFDAPAGDRARAAVHEIDIGLRSVSNELATVAALCRQESARLSSLVPEMTTASADSEIVAFAVAADPEFTPLAAVGEPLDPLMIGSPDHEWMRPRAGAVTTRFLLGPESMIGAAARLKFDAERCQDSQTTLTSRLGQVPGDLRPAIRRRLERSRRTCTLSLERAARRLTVLSSDLVRRAQTPGLTGGVFVPAIAEALALQFTLGAVTRQYHLTDSAAYMAAGSERLAAAIAAADQAMTLLVRNLPAIIGTVPPEWWIAGPIVGNAHGPLPILSRIPLPDHGVAAGGPDESTTAAQIAAVVAVATSADASSSIDESPSQPEGSTSGAAAVETAPPDQATVPAAEAAIPPTNDPSQPVAAIQGEPATAPTDEGATAVASDDAPPADVEGADVIEAGSSIEVIDPHTGERMPYVQYYRTYGVGAPPPILVLERVGGPDPIAVVPDPTSADDPTEGPVVESPSEGPVGGGGGSGGGGGTGTGGYSPPAPAYDRDAGQYTAMPVDLSQPAPPAIVEAVPTVVVDASTPPPEVSFVDPVTAPPVPTTPPLPEPTTVPTSTPSSTPDVERGRATVAVKGSRDGSPVDITPRDMIASGVVFGGVSSGGVAVMKKRARERVVDWATFRSQAED